jgi:SpoVK/Ycf46/Vps4 family AAA+-type ATPase
LARAAAGASGVAFLSLSPAQVYSSSFVGEAEAVVRRAFALARSAAPCILFFDEIDSIFGGSENANSGGVGGSGRGSSAEARILSTFLNEMDGVDVAGAGEDGVLVLGATNRPWTLDSALLRPGRLGDKIIFLPPPDEAARRAILDMQFKTLVQDWDVDAMIELTQGMTGAELVGACQEAKMQWMRDAFLDDNKSNSTIADVKKIRQDYIVNALKSVKPLLSNPQALEEFRIFETRDKKYC